MHEYLGALRHRNFRNLFLGQVASSIGDQVVIVALALYVTERTGSSTDLGVILAAGTLPFVLLLLFGGVWADRLPRQRVMRAADGARALLHALLAILILAGGATVAEMVVIEALFGGARAFFQPAYSGLVPQTIDEELIGQAQALTGATQTLAALIGPALGAACVLTLGAGAAFLLDAATFALSAVLLTAVRPRPRGEVMEPAGTLLHELRAGFAEVRARPWVWATIAAFTAVMLALYATYYSLAPLLARQLYGGRAVFGWTESVIGGGALLGTLTGLRWHPVRPLRTGLTLMLIWPVAVGVFVLHAPLVLMLTLALFAGWGFALFGIAWETALARHVPPHALSRVSSYDWMGSLALLPAGFVLAGPLAGALGARVVLGGGAVIATIALLLSLLPHSTRTLGQEPEPPVEDQPSRRRAVSV